MNNKIKKKMKLKYKEQNSLKNESTNQNIKIEKLKMGK